MNNTTIFGTLNVSGNTFQGIVHIITVIVWKLIKKVIIRNNISTGSSVDLQVGTDLNTSFISMIEHKDMVISPTTSRSILYLKSNKIIKITTGLGNSICNR